MKHTHRCLKAPAPSLSFHLKNIVIMKKTLAFIFFVAITCGYALAQPYGRHHYPTTAIMSSGYRTVWPGNEGFIMAGATGSLIHIEKTDLGGTMPSQTGPTSFQANYTLTSGGLTCMGMTAGTVTPQGGVCAIEGVPPGMAYNYVMAANFTEGVSVTYIDANGAVVNTVAFRFPYDNPTLTRPTVVHEQNGAVYVCGTFDNDIYVFKIQPNGVLAWSNTYVVTGSTSQPSFGSQPHDMILSRPTGEVVIVGTVMPGALFMKLDPNTGAINNFQTYGPNGDCFFSTIKNTIFGDFVVGGLYLNSNNVPAGNPIMMRLTQAGGIIWNTRLITGVPGQNSFGDIIGIEERFNPFTASPEYYGVTETNNNGCTVYGTSVFKLDAAGNPYPGNNEFHYTNDLAGSVINLTINENTPPTSDVGFQIQADGATASVNGYILQESYFNGITFDLSTGCSEILTVCQSGQGPQQMSHQVGIKPGVTQCNDITTTDIAAGSYNSICLSASVPGGSNLKAPLAIQVPGKNTKTVNVHPNPGNGMYTFELGWEAQLIVSDMFGKTLLKTQLAPGNNHIDLQSYPAGIYNAHISYNGKTETVQLVKE
jgi:hypothetical protein